MTELQIKRLEQLQEQMFEVLDSIDDNFDRAGATIDTIAVILNAGERYYEEHKFLLSEAGKQYRATLKKVMIQCGDWDLYRGVRNNPDDNITK